MLLTNLLALYDLKSFGGVLLLVVDVGNGCLCWMLVVGVSAGGLYLVLVILLLLVGVFVLVLVILLLLVGVFVLVVGVCIWCW